MCYLRCHETGVPPSVHPATGEGELQAQALLCQAAPKVSDDQPGAASFRRKISLCETSDLMSGSFTLCYGLVCACELFQGRFIHIEVKIWVTDTQM